MHLRLVLGQLKFLVKLTLNKMSKKYDMNRLWFPHFNKKMLMILNFSAKSDSGFYSLFLLVQ